jgi:hypothetical protein
MQVIGDTDMQYQFPGFGRLFAAGSPQDAAPTRNVTCNAALGGDRALGHSPAGGTANPSKDPHLCGVMRFVEAASCREGRAYRPAESRQDAAPTRSTALSGDRALGHAPTGGNANPSKDQHL